MVGDTVSESDNIVSSIHMIKFIRLANHLNSKKRHRNISVEKEKDGGNI